MLRFYSLWQLSVITQASNCDVILHGASNKHGMLLEFVWQYVNIVTFQFSDNTTLFYLLLHVVTESYSLV